MDFSWTDEQLELKAQVIQFAQAELGSDVYERDKHSTFSRDEWNKCAEFGILGLVVPEVYGGRGHDLLTTVLAMEALGYGCRDNGLTFAINSQIVSVQATLLKAGSEQQKQRYLSGLCRGDLIGAYAITEPDAGSDAFSLTTQAHPVDGGYLLTGRKHLITLAPLADFFIVFATLDPALKRWGITAFLLDRETPGLSISGNQEKLGLRTTPIAEVILDNCFVPEENLLGAEGAGVAIFNESQEWERASILASQLGIMERQLESVVAYAQNREQFGRPIAKFQAVAHRIVDMKLRLDAARLLAYRAAWMIDQGESAMMEAALANIYMAESFVQSSLDAVYTYGGRGYLSENEIERDLRDAIGGPIYGGTSDIQRNIVSTALGL